MLVLSKDFTLLINIRDLQDYHFTAAGYAVTSQAAVYASWRFTAAVSALRRKFDWTVASFYRAAWNADAVYSDENSVCPSVRPSHA